MSEKKAGFRKIGDEAVRVKTGKSWEEWYKILDKRGVKSGLQAQASAKYL